MNDERLSQVLGQAQEQLNASLVQRSPSAAMAYALASIAASQLIIAERTINANRTSKAKKAPKKKTK